MDIEAAYAELVMLTGTLRKQLDRGELPDLGDAERAVELWESIDGWLKAAGFPPAAWLPNEQRATGSESVATVPDARDGTEH